MFRARFVLLLVSVCGLTATTVVLVAPRPGKAQPPASPIRFLAGVVRLLAANRYAEAWTSLNPEQQAVAPLEAYVSCESASPIPGKLVSLEALRVGHDRTGVAVTFALRIAGSPVPEGVRVVLTAHAVAVGDRWTWILPAARLQLYRSHACGYPPAPAM
jgi:hypothetical protein